MSLDPELESLHSALHREGVLLLVGAGLSAGLPSWSGVLLENPAQLAAIRPCFSSDPASYLLAFADQLQDFGRLHYARLDSPLEEETALRLSYPCIAVKVDREGPGKLRLEWSFGPRMGPSVSWTKT